VAGECAIVLTIRRNAVSSVCTRMLNAPRSSSPGGAVRKPDQYSRWADSHEDGAVIANATSPA
jgi:hypothetical protein